ncbi:hypothetical protein EV360DRAFT_79224 [Lentinula raphanica]|nr:hypothetical protein EV360DRAFT_79224 [Lentinula raphanica]
MFFNPLKRPFAIAFASFFIFGSISVTLSAAIPGSEVSSDGLLSARAPPKKIATVSFPEVDIEDAYPLMLNPTDLVELQALFLEKIATDMKDLLKKPELSTITAENLDVAEGSWLRLYRKPSDLQRYIMPYSVKAGDKEYNGMTLQMWNVDDKGKTVTPKARLFRKPYVKQNKDVSTPKELLTIVSRSKFVIITFTDKTSLEPSKPLDLQSPVRGLLEMCPNVTEVIVEDITHRLGIQLLLPDDVRFVDLPTLLELDDRYAVPYKLEHSKSGYSGGQLELLKNAKKVHSRGRVHGFATSNSKGSFRTIEEVEKVLLPMIDMNARAKPKITSVISNLQEVLPTIRGKYWREQRNYDMFATDSPYQSDKKKSVHFYRTLAMLMTAVELYDHKSLPSGRELMVTVDKVEEIYRNTLHLMAL